LHGIEFAMDFLHPNTKSLLDSHLEDEQYLSAAGKDVIIIGGGDTGTDCVATALRHDCASLTQFEIMDQPPLERTADNPWPQWPLVYKLDYGQEEALAVFGEDPREYAIMTKRFIGDEQGNLQAVETVQIRWESNGSGPKLVEVPGSEKTWSAQLVLLAMGFVGPEGGLLDQFGIEKDERSNAKADYGRYQTNIPHIFAAGDARRGQSLVVWAINEGREAAREVDRWLMGETDLP
jgi:glutamate synthase (NADPH/NADH) small chain